MSTIALALLLLVIIVQQRIKKYKIAVFVNGHIVEQYKTNFLPMKGDAINRIKQKKVYYVRNRIQRTFEDTDLIILHCDDISNSIHSNEPPTDSTGSIPQ